MPRMIEIVLFTQPYSKVKSTISIIILTDKYSCKFYLQNKEKSQKIKFSTQNLNCQITLLQVRNTIIFLYLQTLSQKVTTPLNIEVSKVLT